MASYKLEASSVRSQLRLWITLFIAIACQAVLAAPPPELMLNVTGQPPLNTPSFDGFMDEVTREALQRIGYQLVINKLPAERALRQANNGEIDGEMSRIEGINLIYENLIPVPEKIMDWPFIVFSKNPINMKDGWDSLAAKNIGYITGWKIAEKKVPETAVSTHVKDSSQLFNLLERDRVDFVIYEYWGGKSLIELRKLTNVKIRLPYLESREMFIYLHRKHKNLVPKLAQAIANMKKDGSYDRLVQKHLTGNAIAQ